MKKFFALLLPLALALSLSAHAAISEIRADFPKQTKNLKAVAILSAPAADASYLLCVYLSQPASNNLSAIIRWTDENSLAQSFTFSAVTGVISYCNPIRNLANTAPTVETRGTYVGAFDLFVVGFGFWTTGSPSQAGITRPFKNWHLSGSGITLLSPVGASTYLIAADCAGGSTSTLTWTDEVGSQTITVGPSLNGALMPVHVKANQSVVFASGTCYLSALSMGTPRAGPGPLIDYELDLLGYTNVKWPNTLPVLTDGPTTMYIFAGNIAQSPNSSGKTLTLWGDNLFLQILYAEGNGAPGNNDGTSLAPPIGIVGVGYRSGSPSFTFNISTAINKGSTFGWGASPKYSAEVEVIQF